MKKTTKRLLALFLVLALLLSLVVGCGQQVSTDEKTKKITDQLGREVEIPENIERAAGLHIFSAKIMYALGQGDKLVHKAIYGPEGQALEKVSPEFAKLPELEEHKVVNAEELISLNPQVVFCYASFDKADIEKFEKAGLTVVGLKGETLEETYEAIKIIGEVFGCEDKADEYINYVKDKINYIKERAKDIPEDERPRVLVTGPKSMYTVATGDMLQSTMVEMAGGENVASELKGFWTEVSPEQIVTWNPDIILAGSSFGPNSREDIMKNPAIQTINAIENDKVYNFPSNIGWWDFPLPHAVLGMLWTAKTINPDKFEDLDMLATADEYYEKYLGYSFTSMGGKLD